MTAAAPEASGGAVFCTAEKMSAKLAVGMPVQREVLATEMKELKAWASASERNPWTYWQLRQPSQFEKIPLLHVHCSWARKSFGVVLFGMHVASMLAITCKEGSNWSSWEMLAVF